MECPFCIIYSKRTRLLEEKNHVRVILSNPRIMPGHFPIIPERHVERVSEHNAEEQKELFDNIVEFQERILRNVSSGCNIRQNYRPFQNARKI